MANNPKNWNDVNPAAPSGKNVIYQADAPDPNPNTPRDCSSYMPDMTNILGGLVPDPPNDPAQVLLGDGSWGSVPGGGGGGSSSEPYSIREAHADMSGNSIGMYTGSQNTFRWATNGLGGTARVDATATEKLLFQAQGGGFSGSCWLYGNNQSLHLPFTLGNIVKFKARLQLLGTTDQRIFIGLSDWNNGGSPSDFNHDIPNQNFVGFMISTSRGDTKWQCTCQTDSTHQTITPESGSSNFNTSMHVFEFVYTPGTASVDFTIDGVVVGSVSTNLMATSLKMDLVIADCQTAAGAAKNINFDYVSVTL